MNQAKEDALVESAFMSWLADGNRNVYELMRLAIRAAVAAERERCASCADAEASIEGIAQRIAAAIRRGTE